MGSSNALAFMKISTWSSTAAQKRTRKLGIERCGTALFNLKSSKLLVKIRKRKTMAKGYTLGYANT